MEHRQRDPEAVLAASSSSGPRRCAPSRDQRLVRGTSALGSPSCPTCTSAPRRPAGARRAVASAISPGSTSDAPAAKSASAPSTTTRRSPPPRARGRRQRGRRSGRSMPELPATKDNPGCVRSSAPGMAPRRHIAEQQLDVAHVRWHPEPDQVAVPSPDPGLPHAVAHAMLARRAARTSCGSRGRSPPRRSGRSRARPSNNAGWRRRAQTVHRVSLLRQRAFDDCSEAIPPCPMAISPTKQLSPPPGELAVADRTKPSRRAYPPCPSCPDRRRCASRRVRWGAADPAPRARTRAHEIADLRARARRARGAGSAAPSNAAARASAPVGRLGRRVRRQLGFVCRPPQAPGNTLPFQPIVW